MQEQKFLSQKSLWIVLVTTLLSLVGATWITPSFINWYANPFMPQGVSCAPSITWALNKMLLIQLVSVALGFAIGLFFAFKLRKKAPSA